MTPTNGHSFQPARRALDSALARLLRHAQGKHEMQAAVERRTSAECALSLRRWHYRTLVQKGRDAAPVLSISLSLSALDREPEAEAGRRVTFAEHLRADMS